MTIQYINQMGIKAARNGFTMTAYTPAPDGQEWGDEPHHFVFKEWDEVLDWMKDNKLTLDIKENKQTETTAA